MFLTRLRELKIVMAVLLPYVVFGIGSEFLHNHGIQSRPGFSDNAPAFARSHADRGENDCPACSWGSTGQSAAHAAFAVVSTSTIVPVTLQVRTSPAVGSTRPASSRAPPVS